MKFEAFESLTVEGGKTLTAHMRSFICIDCIEGWQFARSIKYYWMGNPHWRSKHSWIKSEIILARNNHRSTLCAYLVQTTAYPHTANANCKDLAEITSSKWVIEWIGLAFYYLCILKCTLGRKIVSSHHRILSQKGPSSYHYASGTGMAIHGFTDSRMSLV